MCGRVTTFFNYEDIEMSFDAVASFEEFMGYNPEEIEAQYNAGPGSKLPIVLQGEQNRLISKAVFGYSPAWATKPMFLFNARAEGDNNQENDPHYNGPLGIVQKPAFRDVIKKQRCLIPVNGFIEGTTKEKLDKPHWVYKADKSLFALAGIWGIYQTQKTFSIITCMPNELMQTIPHHRMPVILEPHQYEAWLNPETPIESITEMLKPYPAELMDFHPINPAIKNPRNNSPELLKEWKQELKPDLFS